MLIIPALDIINGQCVRLTRGDYDLKKVYGQDPLRIVERFEREGADMIHIIDLDGAKEGSPQNVDLILKMRKKIKIPLQVGGGLRNMDSVRRYLNAGIERVILGTKALEDSFLKKLIKEFGPERIVVSIDVRNGKIAENGWQTQTRLNCKNFAKRIRAFGIVRVVVTDIFRDGMLSTPNFDLFQTIQALGFKVIAAGGIADLESIKKLRDFKIDGAILGKALYENKLQLKDALKVVRTSDLAKRVIPCLDVKDGRVVKGVHFQNLCDAGDPVELAKYYADTGADELVFLDIAASIENRSTLLTMVRDVAQNISIPFTVGGGIKNLQDIPLLLQNGADKVCFNTSAVLTPELIMQGAKLFGSQCIVVAIDVKKIGNNHKVFIKGGQKETSLHALEWAKKIEQLGAGEILFTSMDFDGTQEGFDLEILRKVSEAVHIPVIASGGAGSLEHFRDAFLKGKADAVLAASLFHYGIFTISQAKDYLSSFSIPIRPWKPSLKN